MTLRVVDTVLNGACNDAVDRVDVGVGANGTMEFYAGTPPANPTDAPGQNLLATVDFANPAFNAGGTTNPGEAEALSTPLTTTGSDNGTIGWARIIDADGTNADVLWDEDDVGTSGNAITVNTATVSIGVDFQVTSYTFSVTGTP